MHDSAGLYGAETVILTLSNALAITEYHPVIGCLCGMMDKGNALGKAAADNNLEVAYLWMRNKFDCSVVFQLGKLIRQRDIRLIHAHGYKSNLIGLLASKLFNIPIITTNHLFPPQPLEDKKLQCYSSIDVYFTMKRLSRIVAVSHEIKNKLVAKGIRDTKIVIIYNGINIDKYAKSINSDTLALRKSLNINGNAFIVGTLGRLTNQKGHTYLLEAARAIIEKQRIPVVFVIAGDGPLRAQLERQALELNISQDVRFLGFREDTVELLSIMDIFVLPSLDEGLPMAMIEAMASHTPVIATSVGEIPNVVKDGENGILVQKCDSIILAKKISSLLKNKRLRSDLARNAFHIVKEAHSKETMCSKYLELYDEIIRQ